MRVRLRLARYISGGLVALPAYAVYFRGLPACPCQVEWIPVLEAEARRRGIVDGPLPLSQLIGGASASAGTHSKGGAGDVYPLVGIKVNTSEGLVWLCRQMGADATWYRPYNWDGHGGVAHVHWVLRGCPHNEPARYQIVAVDQGYNGLGHLGQAAADTGPRPLSGRTWREGIAWAKEQGDIVTPQDKQDIAELVVKMLTEGKPENSDLTRDQLWKQAQKAADEARDLLKAQP